MFTVPSTTLRTNMVDSDAHRTATDDTPQILQKLADRAAMNATHDSEPVSALTCHPDTRVRTLQALSEWISNRELTTRVQWVIGSAGVGKSAIAQKTAGDHRHQLVGAFFFSRNDTTRDKLDAFVATIAYQCCTSYPLKDIVGPLIVDVIRSNPNVFATSARVQFRRLILEPFFMAVWPSETHIPNLLVVDGIDECVDHLFQQKLIDIVEDAVAYRTPAPFMFLLCSRPEPQIRFIIENAGFASYLDQIAISSETVRFTGVYSESDLDIQKYLQEKFAELRRKYCSVLRDVGDTWPSEDELGNLVWRASGQFIFAVTVINYIDTLDERPQNRLKTILRTDPDNVQDSPYPALDTLYRQILSTCQNWGTIYPILRLIITPHPIPSYSTVPRWHSPSILTRLFQLQPGEIEMLLSKLHSVIHVPDDPDSEIRVLHASFTEFLLDRARSGDYYIPQYSKTEYSDFIAVHLFRTLSVYKPYYLACCVPERLLDTTAFVRWQDEANAAERHTLVGFASANWVDYCFQVDSPSTSLLVEMDAFDPHFVYALTAAQRFKATWRLFDFQDCLRWSQSLGEGASQIFIEKMDSLLHGFYMGYSQECLRHLTIRNTFDVECGLSRFSKWHEAESMTLFIRKFYEQWWKDVWEYSVIYPLLLPTTYDPGQILPKDWIVVHVKKTNGDMLKRVYDTRNSLDKDAQKIFDDDVTYDTSRSVSQNLVKREDLDEFKALLYERRELFANLPRLRPRPREETSPDEVTTWPTFIFRIHLPPDLVTLPFPVAMNILPKGKNPVQSQRT
ncbi:hypothetical protein VNI00_000583 [Paramarasmius palmivorus]|uniref:Nephrocystin 3-like N-terminal domain-containing protein n=1 Tax=Paramarasmius palmivorus TaxID=297713 RepID=A0AAW0E718_9AGAR